MNDTLLPETILFEPWSLGDTIIAVATLRELPYSSALACHPAWQKILRAAVPEKPDLQLIAVDLPYTTRNRSHALDFEAQHQSLHVVPLVSLVLSIRGDFRDYLAARKMFPNARIRMKGWVRFWARKNGLVDFPYAYGLLPIQNRYHSWARIAGIRYDQIAAAYERLRSKAPTNRRIIIHVGAQWRSKQFPDISQLRDLLKNEGYEVILVAGDSDQLPPDVEPESVVRAQDEELVTLLRSAEHVISNDSGPMHLAAFLGCRTTVLVRTSSIDEWLPPGTQVVASQRTPRGYHQKKNYMSDKILPGWPSASAIVESLRWQSREGGSQVGFNSVTTGTENAQK
jgi:hypothetical protein